MLDLPRADPLTTHPHATHARPTPAVGVRRQVDIAARTDDVPIRDHGARAARGPVAASGVRAAGPALDAADSRFPGSDDLIPADVDTAGSAACPAQPGSVGGTLELDVPALSGTVVSQPDSWPGGLRWHG